MENTQKNHSGSVTHWGWHWGMAMGLQAVRDSTQKKYVYEHFLIILHKLTFLCGLCLTIKTPAMKMGMKTHSENQTFMNAYKTLFGRQSSFLVAMPHSCKTPI